jgi:hypothetical protein
MLSRYGEYGSFAHVSDGSSPRSVLRKAHGATDLTSAVSEGFVARSDKSKIIVILRLLFAAPFK